MRLCAGRDGRARWDHKKCLAPFRKLPPPDLPRNVAHCCANFCRASSPTGRRLAGATGSGLGRLQKQEFLSGRATMERPRERAAGRDRRIRSRFARLVANCPQLARDDELRPPRSRRDKRD